MMRPAARIALATSLGLALASSGCGAGQRSTGEDFASEDWQPDAVLALLGIDPGEVVVDLDAGADCFTVRFGDAVAGMGRVVAMAPGDPFPSNLDGAVELVFACDAYHRISDPPAFFRAALAALVPNGRVAIVEPRGGTPADEIAREMREAGYEQIAEYALLPRHSFQIFRADDGTGE